MKKSLIPVAVILASVQANGSSNTSKSAILPTLAPLAIDEAQNVEPMLHAHIRTPGRNPPKSKARPNQPNDSKPSSLT